MWNENLRADRNPRPTTTLTPHYTHNMAEYMDRLDDKEPKATIVLELHSGDDRCLLSSVWMIPGWHDFDVPDGPRFRDIDGAGVVASRVSTPAAEAIAVAIIKSLDILEISNRRITAADM